MTIYSTDENGNMIVIFDSRWRYPELLGYSPDDPQYSMLQRLWEQATGKKVPKDKPESNDSEGKESGEHADQSLQDRGDQ